MSATLTSQEPVLDPAIPKTGLAKCLSRITRCCSNWKRSRYSAALDCASPWMDCFWVYLWEQRSGLQIIAHLYSGILVTKAATSELKRKITESSSWKKGNTTKEKVVVASYEVRPTGRRIYEWYRRKIWAHWKRWQCKAGFARWWSCRRGTPRLPEWHPCSAYYFSLSHAKPHKSKWQLQVALNVDWATVWLLVR